MKRHGYPNLPEEMVFEILSWLPAKSVGQCRCVSKSWRSLLSQPEFIRTHLERSRILNHESLVLCVPMRSLYSALLSDAHQVSDKIITFSATELSFVNCLRGNSLKSVRASCDGLVLVGDYDGWSWVMNPITREIKEVPPSPFTPPGNVERQLYGFGYDSTSHDYKIVVVYVEDMDAPVYSVTFVCVYSLKTGSWKNVGDSPYSGIVDEDLCVFMNHWVMKEYYVGESWSRIIIDDDYDCYSPYFLGDEQAVMWKDGKYFIYNQRQGTSMDIAIDDKSERYGSERFLIVGSFRESLVSPHAP